MRWLDALGGRRDGETALFAGGNSRGTKGVANATMPVYEAAVLNGAIGGS